MMEHPSPAETKKEYVDQRFAFDLSHIKPEDLAQFMHTYEQYNHKRCEEQKKAVANNEKLDDIALTTKYPQLTREQHNEDDRYTYGSTNNFWKLFDPWVHRRLRKKLAQGELPLQKSFQGTLLWLSQSGDMQEMIEHVGYDHMSKLFEILDKLDQFNTQLQKQLGLKPYEPPPLIIEKTISQEEAKQYNDLLYEYKNLLRPMFIFLASQGISWDLLKA